MAKHSLPLPFDEPEPARTPPLRDEAARRAAVDPRENIVLEASAGTGKTRVLVDRYVNLLIAGVEPRNILAITFTRKAAAEMRERIIERLRRSAPLSAADEARWRDLRERLNEIAISTIDAFCLALLREFPLEADLDPGFDIADETAVPRLIDESLDKTLRTCRAIARENADVALLFAQLGERRLRSGLGSLLDRRLVAEDALRRVLSSGPRDLTIESACRQGSARLAGAFESMPGGLEAFLTSGPVGHPAFDLLARDLVALVASTARGAADFPPSNLRSLIDRLRRHFFTKEGTPRKRMPTEYKAFHATKAAASEHWGRVSDAGPVIDDATRALKRDLNVILSRAVRTTFAVATRDYRATLDRHGVLDFAELLHRARLLLGNMEEFARSRFLLEARYHHVLVDEFQDTSRAQWDLVEQLVRAWGEGFGPAHGAIPPSIFIVGDRKQSIYGFRDADVALLDEAAGAIALLRPDSAPVKTITHSFRSAPAILAFINDLFAAVEKQPDRSDAFRYDERDTFPLDDAAGDEHGDFALGLVPAVNAAEGAEAVAAEIDRLLRTSVVRDRQTGVRRSAEPGDVAVLFRTRESHRAYERALERRRIPTYVYKGLGFFDADEVKDIVVVARYLADPQSDIRAAAFLRSRLVRLSDPALQQLAPAIARALVSADPPPALEQLDEEDRRVLGLARASVARWLALSDAVPPAELLDEVLESTAYMFESRGPRLEQARENTKKLRGLVRRIQNRGYLTLGRLADYLDRLSAGDESNAVVDALNAVNLMTVHAAKGLEFPIVFLVNLEQGAGGMGDPIRVSAHDEGEESVAVGDFHAEFDEDASDRDAEETKRLLYVAATRARDRLYLSAVVKDGAIRPGPGSLASVCPKDIRQLIAQALGVDGPITWVGQSGRTHHFAVCAPPAAAGDTTAVAAADATIAPLAAGPAVVEDYAAVADATPVRRLAVTTATASDSGTRRAREASDSDRILAGRLVHRLFQFCGVADGDVTSWRARAERLVTDDERTASEAIDAVIDDAVAMYAALRDRADVRATLESAPCFYEVPFSLWMTLDGPVVIRGVIDCLVVPDVGDIVVLDFKTGMPRESDQRQMAIYEEAARRAFPGREVRGLLAYSQTGEREQARGIRERD
jgi:ATP-dependent helicase/nuclease subunit A